VVDIGANTSVALLAHMAERAARLKKKKSIELGVVVVVTSEPSALTHAADLIAAAQPWATAVFVVENRLHGEVECDCLRALAGSSQVAFFEKRNELILIAHALRQAVRHDDLGLCIDGGLGVVALDVAVLGQEHAALGIGEVALRLALGLRFGRRGRLAVLLASLGDALLFRLFPASATIMSTLKIG
jgi:hypothetical protein